MKRNGLTWALSLAIASMALAAPATAVDVASFKERISPRSSFLVPLAVSPAQETFIDVHRAGNRVGVCCQYINQTSHCADASQAVCLDNQQCPAGVCVPSCSSIDFRFLLDTTRSRVVWFVGMGNAPEGIPPVAEFPFFGQLLCLGAPANRAGEFECPCVDPCNSGVCPGF